MQHLCINGVLSKAGISFGQGDDVDTGGEVRQVDDEAVGGTAHPQEFPGPLEIKAFRQVPGGR
ncbi:MAG: hypothetical protein U1U88_001881 [Lawsonella clevelandensis]